ncbi:Uncharacterised protein [Serratia fonticola]|nr:Uncharacterised protein [Serratia fonticola]
MCYSNSSLARFISQTAITFSNGVDHAPVDSIQATCRLQEVEQRPLPSFRLGDVTKHSISNFNSKNKC